MNATTTTMQPMPTRSVEDDVAPWQTPPVPRNNVTTAYRPKRPPRKRKTVAITGPAIVTKASRRAPADTPPGDDEQEPAAPPHANDDSPVEPAPPAAKSVIVTTTSRKRVKLERAAERAAERDDPEATARVKAFVARMIRPPQ
jgi:hypothetical protein